jgi:hypothetical protein
MLRADTNEEEADKGKIIRPKLKSSRVISRVSVELRTKVSEICCLHHQDERKIIFKSSFYNF